MEQFIKPGLLLALILMILLAISLILNKRRLNDYSTKNLRDAELSDYFINKSIKNKNKFKIGKIKKRIFLRNFKRSLF